MIKSKTIINKANNYLSPQIIEHKKNFDICLLKSRSCLWTDTNAVFIYFAFQSIQDPLPKKLLLKNNMYFIQVLYSESCKLSTSNSHCRFCWHIDKYAYCTVKAVSTSNSHCRFCWHVVLVWIKSRLADLCSWKFWFVFYCVWSSLFL